ncbi:MAG TPA: hypothetical protein PKM63_10610 [Panacibacter sp.]|nr:hypothetical protein [Panacibacter sp.]HNP44729.1 hypothetical protein [Panacibacter sp.]
MKYILLICCICILSVLTWKYFLDETLPAEFAAKQAQQQNPFVIEADSAAVVWQRAKDFLQERRRLIAGGALQQNDSLLYIPYYTNYHKGNSIMIEKKNLGDSVQVTCRWWYSKQEQADGGKEIALYMQTGISRYDYK